MVTKIHAKLGGVNRLISLMSALTSPSAESDIFMFFGIDCRHVLYSREQHTVAAIYGSINSTSSFVLF